MTLMQILRLHAQESLVTAIFVHKLIIAEYVINYKILNDSYRPIGRGGSRGFA